MTPEKINNFVTQIYRFKAEFEGRYNKPPTALYLGITEYFYFIQHCESFSTFQMRMNARTASRATWEGMEVFKVAEAHHLGFGWTPEEKE
jgi:hypothetical protein